MRLPSKSRSQPTAFKGEHGFTLNELMIAVSVIGILTVMGASSLRSAKERAIDVTMRSDLRNAMTALEDYRIQYGEMPADAASFEAGTGFELTPGVTWKKFDRQWNTSGHQQGINTFSVRMRVEHPQSPHEFRADYPADGVEIRQHN